MTDTEKLGKNGLAIAFVVLLVISSVMVFLVVQAWTANNPDPYQQTREYTFEGTLDDSECLGTGTCTFSPESYVYHLYSVEITVESADAKEEIQFPVLFGEDDLPDSSDHAYEGEVLIDDQIYTIWKGERPGFVYTIYVGEKCVMGQIEIDSDNMHITGYLNN